MARNGEGGWLIDPLTSQGGQVIEIVQILLELLAEIRAKAHITED